MRQLLYVGILIMAFSGNVLADDKVEKTDSVVANKDSKNTKDNKDGEGLSGIITQPKIALEVREKMIADKELELAHKEKKLNDDNNALIVARKQLVQEALNVKAALNTREKELTQKAATVPKLKKKVYPDATKKLGDLINEVSEKNPVKHD